MVKMTKINTYRGRCSCNGDGCSYNGESLVMVKGSNSQSGQMSESWSNQFPRQRTEKPMPLTSEPRMTAGFTEPKRRSQAIVLDSELDHK